MKSGLIRVLFLAALGTASFAALQVCSAPSALAEPQVSGLAVQAVKLALAGKFEDAGALAVRSKDEAAIKLVELIYLRDHPKEAGYGRIMEFLNSAPGWPLVESLNKRAERTLWSNNEPSIVVPAHSASRKPVTPEGTLALARAKLATGDRQAADRLVKSVWSDPDIDAKLEAQAASEFKSLLSLDDYKARMERLIYAQEPNAAIRDSKRLGSDYQAAAKVAQALINGSSGADKQVGKLSAAMKSEPAIKYALAHYYRKRENWPAARAVLASVPASVSAQGYTDVWWGERRIFARHSVGPNHRDGFAQAYQIASAHGFTSGDGALEGEFLAGWIALRSLKDAGRSLPHFQKLDQLAETRTDKA